MDAPTYPDTFRSATAYLTAYIDMDDNPRSEALARETLAELNGRPREDIVIVFSAMIGALVAELAAARSESTTQTWARHATTYSTVLVAGGE